MSRRSNDSNIIQFPPKESLAYYERQIAQGDLRVPRSFVEEIVWTAQWLDDPQNRSVGFLVLTEAMDWPPHVANKVLDSLEAIGYAGFPEQVPIPEEFLEIWQAMVKNVLRMPLRLRARLEVWVAHESETKITEDMVTEKYKELKRKRRRARRNGQDT